MCSGGCEMNQGQDSLFFFDQGVGVWRQDMLELLTV